MRGLALICALLFTAPALAAPKPFAADSYKQLVAAHAGQPFALVLWSLDCPPCHEELALLGRLSKASPRLPVVLIATDTEVPPEQLDAVLRRHGLAGVESWVFADPVPARLRQAIDPDWYGELPRSYFFSADGKREAHSGLLSEQALRAISPGRASDRSGTERRPGR